MTTLESRPLVSIIIVTYNCVNLIGPCLDSVLISTYPNIEIIVIDNASRDGTPEYVSRRYPNVALIQTGRNLGFGGGNNFGIRKAKGDYILLLNPDTIVDPYYVSELYAVESSDPSVAMVGGKILMPDGRIQSAGATVDSQGYTINYGFGKPGNEACNELKDVDYVGGGAAMVTRSALATIGLLDPIYTLYYEDTDWCWRARRRGMKVIYVPGARVLHFGGGVPGKFYPPTIVVETSRITFVLRNFTRRKLVRWAYRESRRFINLRREAPYSADLTRFLRIFLAAYWNNIRILPLILVRRFRDFNDSPERGR
jgi:GT2 family glycosyltransferase